MLNPEEFLSGTVEGASSTQLKPIPAGEFRAVCDNVELKSFEYKKGDRAGETGYRLVLVWHIDDEGLKAELGRNPTMQQSIFLDMKGDSLDMSEGKNVTLGRVRQAVGQNEPGKPWSPLMLKGAVAVLSIKQEVDGEDIRSNIDRVVAA